ncbi:MAG: hypothetical protein AAFZ11_12480 [Pseudomonadota bacterium]
MRILSVVQEFDYSVLPLLVRAARQEGILLSNGRLPQGDFDSAFPDVAVEAQFLEAVTLDTVASWLKGRRDKGDSSISVSGLSAPLAFLQDFGVIIITVFQFYSWLHISNCRLSVGNIPKNNQAYWIPWIVLYPPPWSTISIFWLALLPALMAATVMRERQFEFFDFISLLNLMFVFLSASLSYFTIRDFFEIRALAISLRSEESWGLNAVGRDSSGT